MSSHVHAGAQSLRVAGIGEATTAVCLAVIAARLCSRDVPDISDAPISDVHTTDPRGLTLNTLAAEEAEADAKRLPEAYARAA